MGVAGVTNANFQAWRSGFPITCASCIDGSTVSGVAFTSVTSYDETQTGGGDFSNAAHYIDLPSDANTINNGQGYWVYMGNSSPGTGTGAEVITVSGTPQQGSIPLNFTFTDASNGANLLANPFPSPISWSTVMANNPAATIDGVCYIYNAQDGSYGTLDAAGLASGSYGLSDDVIPTGMAFYVQAMASGSLVFDESVKSVGSTQDLQRQSSHNIKTQAAQIPRFSIQALGTNMQSRTLFAFDSRANIGIDHTLDAPYLVGSEPIRISSQISGKDFSINGLPDLNQNYSIPVKMVVTTTGSYQISALNLQNMPTGACLILHDNSDNSNYDLRQGSHAITLNSTDVGARFVLNISITTLAITANATQATCPASHDGYITAAGNNAGPWNYTWKNANNTIVRTTTNLATADILNGLNTGVYSVDVNTVGTCDNATQSFTLTLPATVNSAFSVTSNTVFVNNNMTFTDNSTNANSYWWDFGDGNNSSLQSPVYAYNTIGTIDITFYAINTVCADTAISTQSIDVLSTMGIAGGVANGDIILSKDQNGTFIKFNYGGQTKVNINVYNALGQTILTNTGVNVANDKIYLNLDNAKDQLVFVSIANLDKNTQVTKKLYNN